MQTKNKNSSIEVLTSTNFQDLAPAKISKLNKVFGIISYLPDKESDRIQRIARLEQLLDRLHEFWSDVPIMIIAQNWKEYLPKNDIIKYAYDKLGILTARKMLRKHFLESKYDYLIMFDDDAIIECEDKNAPKLYMAELDKYPNGFCFIYGGNNKYNPYVDSQLNLCAISRYIYEKEDMVNIDAQKSEGFEDRVFSLLLHVKYSEYEFFAPTAIKCTHFKNPNIDEHGGEVPSTWANNQKYDWLRMRENTLQIEQYILKYKELPDLKTFLNILSDANISQSSAQELNFQKLKKDTDLKSNINVNINKSINIDLVITYVDSTDKEWQKIYTKYAPISKDVQVIGKQRFRNNPHFKYLFRGIEKYAPWINNVFLIVQSYSQVPKWINQERVKIILHEDIIPSEYLPVFNSQAIEMFLHKIPDLSEKFLYSNDDMYFVGDMHPEDFFTEDNKVKTSFHFYSYDSNKDIPLWKKALINSAMLTNKIEAEELKHEGKCLTPMHSIRPYFKSKIEEVHEQYSTEIFNSISKFRESKNFTVYLYDFYLKSLGATVKKNYTSVCFSSISSVGLVCTAIINPNIYKTICINDTTEEEDKKRIATITEHFESQFPNLSKYDVLN